jgi:hypothetical protein
MPTFLAWTVIHARDRIGQNRRSVIRERRQADHIAAGTAAYSACPPSRSKPIRCIDVQRWFSW